MKTKPTRLFAATVLLWSAPVAVFAQGIVVPPPAMPGSVTAAAVASAPTPVAAAVTAPMVAPPEKVSSAAPGANAPALIDLALPAAPVAPDLRPAAPAAPKVASRASATVETPKKPKSEPEGDLDPYAGLSVTPVSDAQLNRFVFPEAIEGVYFAEGAPLPECADNAGPQDPCKPVFLNGKKMMLLQLRAGAKGPVQMLVHLQSGRIVTLNLMPAPGPGSVTRVDGAEDGASDTRLAMGRADDAQQAKSEGLRASEQHVELLSQFARGSIPGGFESVAPGQAIRFDYFDMVPMATWSNGAGLRVRLTQIVAHGVAPVAISASLFQSDSVRALALDRETITDTEPALLYTLELQAEGAN